MSEYDGKAEIQKLEEHLSTHPDSERFVELASLFLASDRPRDALRVCEKGMGFHPTLPAGHLNYGKALVRLNQIEEGIKAFERACALASTDPGVWTEIAAFLEEHEHPEMARPYIDRALALAPNDPRVLNLLSARVGLDSGEAPASLEPEVTAKVKAPQDPAPVAGGFGEWEEKATGEAEGQFQGGGSMGEDEPEPPTLYVSNPLLPESGQDAGPLAFPSHTPFPTAAPTIADPVPQGTDGVVSPIRSGPRATEPPTIYSPDSASAPWMTQEPEPSPSPREEPPTQYQGGHPTVAAQANVSPPTMLAASAPAVTMEARPPVAASGSFSYFKVFLVLIPFLVVGLGLGVWVALRHIRADKIADLYEQARSSMALDTLAGYNDAREALDKLFDLDSEHLPARALKALLLARLGDEYGPNLALSEEARRLVDSLAPVPEIQATVLWARLHLNDTDTKLREQAAALLAAAPEDPHILSLAAEIDLRFASAESARKHLQDSLQRDGAQVRVLYQLGQLERMANKLDQAEEALMRALTVNGLHVRTLLALADVRLARGKDLEQARADMAKILELPQVTDRQKAEAHLRLAHLSFLSLERPRAVLEVRAGHELLPDDRDYQLRLMRLCLEFFELDEVAVRTEKLLAAEPDNVELRLAAIENLLHRGKAQEALRQFEPLAGKKVPAARFYLARGEAQRQLGKLDAALQDFERLSKEDSQYYVRGRAATVVALIQKDDLDAARRAALAMEREFPNEGLSQWALGMVALARKNERAAATAFAEALRRNSRCHEAAIGLADLAQAHQKLDEAADLLSRALAIHPYDGRGRLLLGQVELRRGNPAVAEQAFARLLLDQPGHAQALVGLAEALLLQGQLDKAERSIRMARRSGADDAKALSVEGRILLAMGRFFPAARVLKEADAKEGRNPSILTDLGLALLGARNLSQAEKALRQSLAIQRQLKAQEGLAEVLALRGQHSAAAAAWEKAALLAQREKRPAPECVRLYLAGGRAWVRQGTNSSNLAQARRLFSAAAKLAPEDPVPVFELAAAYDRDDKLDRARPYYEKALALAPEHPEALFRLGLLEFEQHRDARAKELLEKFLAGGAKGANAKRAREVLRRIK